MHQREESGLFSYVGGLSERKPRPAPKQAPGATRNTATKARNLPPCKPLIQKYLRFCPLEVSQNTEKTLAHLKKYFIFAPFQPILSRFALFEVLPESRAAPMLPVLHYQAGCKRGNPQGTRERERAGTRSPQAHKKGVPPHRQGAGSRSPPQFFAPKNQQKVAWGRFEKIFGKIFRGNVSGERKTPRVVSTEGGCLTNENREISNLGNANNQKHKNINHQGQR